MKNVEEIEKDENGNCVYCGQKCWKDGGQMCDEQQAGGFNNETKTAMYQISANVRKYSPTPIVEIITDEKGNKSEKIVFVSTLTKKEGNEISERVVKLLNQIN
jgi:hypothetical protein